MDEIKTILNSENEITENELNEISESLIDLRVKAANSLSDIKERSYFEIISEVSEKIEQYQGRKSADVLNQNILFALRTFNKVIESVRQQDEAGNLNVELNILSSKNYNDYLHSQSALIGDKKLFKTFSDWIKASLKIEFVLISADLIRGGIVRSSENLIDKLSFLVADSSQEFYALAVGLGMISISNAGIIQSDEKPDRKFIDEQKKMSDIGIEDFDVIFTK